MKKVVVFISTLIIISFLISCTGESLSNSIGLADRKSKSSFSSIVISQYNTEKFERLNIEKKINDNVEITYSNDNVEIANNFLEYFKKLEIEEIEPHNIPDEAPSRELYEINFISNETYSKIKIEILNDEYIRILNYIYTKKYNKKENRTKYEESGGLNWYKISNQKLDLQYIEEVYNSLDPN